MIHVVFDLQGGEKLAAVAISPHMAFHHTGTLFIGLIRLNDALRRYQAQQTRVVATPLLELINLALLIKQLREEGALLQHQENTLLIRPTHWQQVDRLGPHWKAVLLVLQTNDNVDQ